MKVSGVKGSPATDTYKVSISYRDGYKAMGQLTVCAPDAVAKAELSARIIFERLALDGIEFGDDQITVEMVGNGVCLDGVVPPPQDPPEVVLRVGVHGDDKAKVDRFGTEIVPLVTSGPPGVTGFAGGRPKAQEVIGYWPALLGKGSLETTTKVVES